MSNSALIIAPPGPVRDGLRALMSSMPQLRDVEVAVEVRSVPSRGLDGCPGLVLVDVGSSVDQVWLTVRRTRTRCPAARLIVLVSNVEQQDEAEAAGADAVLMQGFPPGRLVAAIVRLFPQPVA